MRHLHALGPIPHQSVIAVVNQLQSLCPLVNQHLYLTPTLGLVHVALRARYLDHTLTARSF